MSDKFCGKCGTELYDGSAFCPQCGNQTAPSLTCPDCGRQLHPETEMCPGCGKLIEEPVSQSINITEDSPVIASGLEPSFSIEKSSSQEPKENAEMVPQEIISEKKHKLLKAQSTIQLAKTIILMIGIIILVQSVFLLTMITGMQGVTETARRNSQNSSEYRGFGERSYKNTPDENRNSPERGFSQERRRMPVTPKMPKIPGNMLRLLILVIAIGILQGGGFILLSRWVDKKPFLAILIAFIFEITYDILKVVIALMRAVQGIGLGQTNQVMQMMQGSGLKYLLILQAVQIAAVSIILCFYLGKALWSAVELRKMSEK